MSNEYDEEAPDGKKSTTMQEAKPIKIETFVIDDDADETGAYKATTTSSTKDMGSELEGLPEGLPGVRANEGANEIPEQDTVHPIDEAEELVPFYPSRKKFTRRTHTNAHDKYPQDCYSFIALNGPERGKPWTRQRVICVLFGLLPFVFQMLLLVLLAFSQTNELRGTIGETDNPDQSNNDFMGLFAKFIPSNSTPTVRWAQVTSLAAYVIFPSSSLQDIVRAVQLFPYYTKEQTDRSVSWLRVSCILRAMQGVTAMVVTLLLVLTSVTVVDIILNFTAVNFISGLDEDAFFLATSGDFSPALNIEAERIGGTHLPPCMFKKDESRWKCYQWITSIVYLFLFGVVTFVFVAQNSKSVWVTELLRVQFQDSTGLNEYSGCFKVNTVSSSVEFSRRTYHSLDTGSLNTTFGYCREGRQWLLFKGNTTDPCHVLDEEGLLLARSSKTNTFDISAVFEESWVSTSNTPLSLYFFDGSNETDIRQNCGLTLDDGLCDPVFNELGYSFDGGDCCAATCTKSNCGRGGLTSVFGDPEVSGDGFEDCVDPSMVPITIHLNNMTSSRDPKFTGWYTTDDTLNPTYWDYDEIRFVEWMEAVPVKSYFALDCDGKNVMTAYLESTMINKSQTIMVEDGAVCTLIVHSNNRLDENNRFDNEDIMNNPPFWSIDYTIYHDNAFSGDDGTGRVEILSSLSVDDGNLGFVRIPDCYFKKLHNHVEIESIYTGTSSSNQAIDWLVWADSKQRCEDSTFIERYAVAAINFAMNPTKLFISREEQCRWESINCKEGKILSIQLQVQELQGDVPTELGLISDLQTLQLDNNLLSSLPREIGQLSILQALYLSNNQLLSLPTEIGNLRSLQELRLDNNQLVLLPAEIGNLSRLRELDLNDNELVALPSGIENFSNLQELRLSENQFTSLPSEIWGLSSLEIMHLAKNNLESLPTEISNLHSLRFLQLYENQLKSLPSEIGSLTNLVFLDVDVNQLESLPAEIGRLTSLGNLNLVLNQLESLPTEIGNLRSLRELYMYKNQLKSLPSEIGNLADLLYLDLDVNQLESLPAEIGGLTSLRTLNLDNNQLTSLPTEIGNLSLLEKVWLRENLLASLPSQIGNLSSLQFLDLLGNKLKSLPSEIGNLLSLQDLDLDYNDLISLPTEIGHLSSLQDLDLWGNQLTSVPTEIGNLLSLEYLDLDGNQLTSLPTEIGNLSLLKQVYFNNNELTSIPSQIGNLLNLQELYYDANVELPEEVLLLCSTIECVSS